MVCAPNSAKIRCVIMTHFSSKKFFFLGKNRVFFFPKKKCAGVMPLSKKRASEDLSRRSLKDPQKFVCVPCRKVAT